MSAEMAADGFGKQRYTARGKERAHISRSKLVHDSAAEQVGLGEEKTIQYIGWQGKRYLSAERLAYDFIVTLYDVNSSRAWIARLFEPKGISATMASGLSQMMKGNTNLEARIIGLQDKEDSRFLAEIVKALTKAEIRLIESDLFGSNVRHIAMDLKTGASFDILLEDRLYRPGELANSMTIDDFRRGLLKAPAV